MEKKLFEGTPKPVLDNTDRFTSGYPNIDGAQYTTKEELFEQIRIEQGTRLTPTEVTSIAPFSTGTATGGTTSTIIDSTKAYTVNELAGKVAVRYSASSAETELRVITSNTATEITIETFKPFSSATIAGDTFKVITPTVVADTFRNQIIRVNLSSGFDHVVQHPRVTDNNNRNVITTYVEGHTGTAICYGITTPSPAGPSGNQTFNGIDNSFELVANRELVSHAAHAVGSFHYDLLYSSGLQAFGEGTWAPQVITVNQTSFTPVDSNLTPFVLRRFEGVTVGGQFWGKYTSQIKRNFLFNIICDGVLNGPTASIIEVGLRHYSVETGLTTDYSGVGGNVSVSGTGTAFRFNLVKNLQLSYGDRFQIVHKNNNATDYTLTPQLTVD